MKLFKFNWKISLGILISLLFMFLAFRKVDFFQMWSAIKLANYWWLFPVVLLLIFSHWMRSLRWKILIAPVYKIKTWPLFSALMIGYMANTFVPAHLGEFLRAWVVSRKHPVTTSAVFATIVMDRFLDAISLLVLMGLTLIVHPFPEWVKNSGYVTFAFLVVFAVALYLMKKYREKGLAVLRKTLFFLPEHFKEKALAISKSFLDGIAPLKNPMQYVYVIILTVIMWACYIYAFQVAFYAFDFVNIYSLPWETSLVLLVITTISIAVPSSPGYIGTYHYMCQIGLGLFGVPEAPALSFAFVAHGVLSLLTPLILGLIFITLEGISIKNLGQKPFLDNNSSF